MLPALSGRRRTRALRAVASAQITTNAAFEAFLTRGFWGRMLWLFFGR
jgi:hypothetical protein